MLTPRDILPPDQALMVEEYARSRERWLSTGSGSAASSMAHYAQLIRSTGMEFVDRRRHCLIALKIAGKVYRLNHSGFHDETLLIED